LADYTRALVLGLDDKLTAKAELFCGWANQMKALPQLSDKVLAHYTRAIGLAAHLEPRDVASAYNGRGLIYLERKDYPRAIAEFKQASGRAPKNDEALDTLGVSYGQQGDKVLSKKYKDEAERARRSQ